MGNDYLRRWALGCLLLLASCGGGQTGQPTSGEGDPEDCSGFDKVPPLDCCRPLEPDEQVDGLSARDILAARGNVSAPLFWSEIPESGEAVLALEPDQAQQTTLSLELTLDEETPVQFCNEIMMNIPVHARVTTDDGFEAEFSATWEWGPFFEAVPAGGLQGPAEVFEVPGLTEGMNAQCPAIFSFGRFDSDVVSGRFCDAERGLALFPTACGGLAQLALDESPPFSLLDAPSESLVWSDVGLFYEDLPEIDVSVELDDVSACYESDRTFWVDVRLTVETGGVTFTAERAHGHTEWSDSVFNPVTEQFEPALRTSVEEVCGDVFGSTEWRAIPNATDRLCIAMHQTRFESGTARRFAEVIFEGTDSGWVFVAP